MKNSRRRFLQIAGVSALGLGATPVLNAFAAGGDQGPGYHIAKGEDALTAATARADALLLNVLPASIAERLKAHPQRAIADRYDDEFVKKYGASFMRAKTSPVSHQPTYTAATRPQSGVPM